jgi:hypothetical protein
MFKTNILPCSAGGGPAIPALLKSALQLVQLQHLPQQTIYSFQKLLIKY